MTFQTLIELCLSTDPNIVSGDYTILLSNSKSGVLNSGVLLFTEADLPKTTISEIEYRLVSILMMLIDIEEHRAQPDAQQDIAVSMTSGTIANAAQHADELITALTARGIAKTLAEELVNRKRTLPTARYT